MIELIRILKKNGMFIIREHDCNEKYLDKLIDIEHGLYAVTVHNDQTFYKEYYGKYRDWIDWNIILTRSGFEYIHHNYVLSPTYSITPTRSFYGIYKKIKDL